MYKNWKSVPIPPRMAKLPKDKRGYPIPYIIAYDKHGVPKFQINDDTKVERCIQYKLCAICGQQMLKDQMWLVGGPQSAFHEYGAYIDTPTHKGCLNYALVVCPYLALSKYTNRIDMANVKPGDMNFVVVQDQTQEDERVPYFVAINVSGYEVVRRSQFSRVLVPNRPFLAVERWHDGKRITEEQAAELQQADDKRRAEGGIIPLEERLAQMHEAGLLPGTIFVPNSPSDNAGGCPFGYDKL